MHSELLFTSIPIFLIAISHIDHKNIRLPYPRSLARDPRLEGSLRRAQRTPPTCWQEGILDVFFLGFLLFSLVRFILPPLYFASPKSSLWNSISHYELMTIWFTLAFLSFPVVVWHKPIKQAESIYLNEYGLCVHSISIFGSDAFGVLTYHTSLFATHQDSFQKQPELRRLQYQDLRLPHLPLIGL